MLTHARRPSRVASCDARTTAVLCVDSTTTPLTFCPEPARHTDGLRLVLQIVLLLGIGTTCTELCPVLHPGMPIALPNYALCFILPLTLPHSRLNEVANLEQLESESV